MKCIFYYSINISSLCKLKKQEESERKVTGFLSGSLDVVREYVTSYFLNQN